MIQMIKCQIGQIEEATEKSSIEFFVSHGPTHSEVWEINEIIDKTGNSDKYANFFDRDGKPFMVHRYLFNDIVNAETFVDSKDRLSNKYFDVYRRY